MKLHKPLILSVVFSICAATTVFAFEPIQLNPDLIKPNLDFPLLDQTLPEEEIVYTDDPSIYVELWGSLNDDGTVSLDWEQYYGADFLWYKILWSQENKPLMYPRDGYLDYYDDSTFNYYDDMDPPFGKNFYRICVITTDNRRGCSNQIMLFKQNLNLVDTAEAPFRPILPADTIDTKPDLQDKPNTDLPNKEDLPPKDANDSNKGGFWNSVGKFIVDQSQVLLGILALILAATGFTFAAKRKQRSISKYINEIDNTYSEFKMKSKRCEAELYRLRDIVDEQLKTGKLDEGAYQLLMNRIEGYMVEVQKQIVNEKFGGLPENLKNELFNMMESGDISEKEYEKFQSLINKSELSGNDQSTLLKTVKDFQSQGEKLKRKGAKED